MTTAAESFKACVDGSRTLLRELEKIGEHPPEELVVVQDLLECIDRNAEQIALALAGSRRRKTSDGLGAVAGLLREQEQYLKQVFTIAADESAARIVRLEAERAYADEQLQGASVVDTHTRRCKPRQPPALILQLALARAPAPPSHHLPLLLPSMGKQHLARGVGRMSEMVMAKGKGSWVWTTDNRKLLDFTSGIAVTNLGHCHPRVVQAVQEQVATLVHAQVNIGYHEPMLKLTDRLLPHMPKGLDSLFFATTGSEAVENAVKLARHSTGKQNIIVFQGGYHGRTIGAMSLTTSKTIYSAGFGPLMSGVTVVPFPYAIHGPIHDEEQCGEWCLDQLRLALKQQTAPTDTAAILIEPVMGEGGYVVPPKSFMKGLREICSEHNILLIADEVQCGFGRTGEYFAIDGHFDVTPDILVIAKGIANGFPLSGIASRKELTDKQAPGSMGGTYAGNAVSCAAALAVQDVFDEENILENTRARGAQYMAGLQRLKDSGKYPIRDVRGLGLMIGIEFDNKKVPYGTAAKVSNACLDHGMMILTTSVYETLRFMPPLTISAEECDLGLEIFEKALNDVFCK